MKGARALASGMLVLGAVCVLPAVSAAQDAASPTATTTTTATVPDPATPPADPGTTSTTADQGLQEPADPANDGEPAVPEPTSEAAAPAVTVSSSPGKAHAAASASVTMGDFFFSPASVTVAVGDTVTWHNTGQAPHTATADDGSFDTGTINAGGSGSHRFSTAGTFSYICTIHPNMKGTVRVLSSSASGGGGGGNTGSNSSGSATSEASAVASPDAAGNSSTLPMTGMAVGSLALVGLALLASGLIARRFGEQRGWFSIF
jgi:plastocyanin